MTDTQKTNKQANKQKQKNTKSKQKTSKTRCNSSDYWWYCHEDCQSGKITFISQGWQVDSDGYSLIVSWERAYVPVCLYFMRPCGIVSTAHRCSIPLEQQNTYRLLSQLQSLPPPPPNSHTKEKKTHQNNKKQTQNKGYKCNSNDQR